MEAIRVKIEQNCHGYLFTSVGHSKCKTSLFCFRQDNVATPEWRFFPEFPEKMVEITTVIFEGTEFPQKYFEQLCKAKFFVMMGVDEYPEEVNVVAGKKYLKWSLK